MGALSDQVVEKIKTRMSCPITCLENPAVYVIMRKNIAEQSRPQFKIWRMRIAC
jgi:hypothetical protein